ncbi:MAG: hypothetical protein QOJ43_768 [Gaiellaceae bacterium]|nr:hypothetical protein [Gaiellaceae bacterium]
MRWIILLVVCGTALLCSPAQASEQLGDVDVRFLGLKVNGRGEALVSYLKPDGARRDVLVWSAVGARAPDPDQPQVRFRFDYSGGPSTRRTSAVRAFRNRCRSYDGPALVFLVAACKAPDGSYWALQRWQRLLPMRGFEPFRPGQAAFELHVSHWTGALPQLEVSPNWTYGGRWQGLFGRLTYLGAPVHGFRTPSAKRADPYARFFYIDTFNSVYGPGWRHDAGKVTHKGNGAFCFSFVPQLPPAGYPSRELRGPGNGERHRVTIMGPGVTPVVQWEGTGLARYDAAADRGFNTLFDRLVGADAACARER